VLIPYNPLSVSPQGGRHVLAFFSLLVGILKQLNMIDKMSDDILSSSSSRPDNSYNFDNEIGFLTDGIAVSFNFVGLFCFSFIFCADQMQITVGKRH
jgi:hypothetical protein